MKFKWEKMLNAEVLRHDAGSFTVRPDTCDPRHYAILKDGDRHPLAVFVSQDDADLEPAA